MDLGNGMTWAHYRLAREVEKAPTPETSPEGAPGTFAGMAFHPPRGIVYEQARLSVSVSCRCRPARKVRNRVREK